MAPANAGQTNTRSDDEYCNPRAHASSVNNYLIYNISNSVIVYQAIIFYLSDVHIIINYYSCVSLTSSSQLAYSRKIDRKNRRIK